MTPKAEEVPATPDADEEELAPPDADEEVPATPDAEMKEIENELTKQKMIAIEKLIEKKMKDDKSQEEAKEEKKYPQDCFSLIELNGPIRGFRPFLFGMFVILFQVAIYSVYLYNAVGSARAPEYIRDYYGFAKDFDQSDRWKPMFKDYDSDPSEWAHTHENIYYKNTTTWTMMHTPDEDGYIYHGIDEYNETLSSRPFWYRATVIAGNGLAQALAMLAYVLFPEGGMEDFIKTIQALGGGCTCASPFVVVLRLLHSLLAIYTVAVLIMDSSQPIDVFLNFAAMNFVSQLDESAFGFAKDGMFGETLEKETTNIAEGDGDKYLAYNPKPQFKRTAYHIAMAIVLILFIVAFLGGDGLGWCGDDSPDIPFAESAAKQICKYQFDILGPLKKAHAGYVDTPDIK